MNKFLLTAFAVVFAASGASAAGFALNTGSPALVLKAAANMPAPEAPSAPVKTKGSSLVQVSGYVTLSGNAWLPQNGGYTSVNLNGWATFRDSTGKVTSNNTYLNTYASMWIYPNQHVFQTVWPNVYVQFYRNGKSVGSANMTGSISVSGWPSGSMVMLNGSGYLNGSLYVEDEQ